MRADIQPQWRKLAAWYWEEFNQPKDKFLSIWEMLERDYGARKAFSLTNIPRQGMWVVFPDEKSYIMFALKWS